MRRGNAIVIFLFAAIVTSGLGGELIFAEENGSKNSTPTIETLTRDELASQIEEKTKQLEEIDGELETTKEELGETQKERRTLQRELRVLQGNINQLDLNVRADKIRIEKLGLEINSLNYDLRDIQSSISSKKLAIAKIMVELQKQDRSSDNFLVVFLQSASLAEGFLRVQALKNLQNQLTVDIAGLLNLHDTYSKKIQATNTKRDDSAFHKRNLEYRLLITADKKAEQQTLLTQTRNRESVFQKQVEELEKLKKEIANEVEALGAILRTKIDPALLPPLASGVLAMPIDTSLDNLTQDYGSTNFAKFGYRGKWHNGVDIRASLGTPVLAAEEGTITAIGNQDKYCYRGAYGRFIMVNHSNNLTTMYAHLSRIVVGEGQTVERGEVIGYSGSSGYATGPHLHFTVFAQPTFYMGPSKVCGPMPFGGDLNPVGYL